jgi:type III pantothenate kinase
MLRVQHSSRTDLVWLSEIERWLDDLPLIGDARFVVASVHERAADALSKRLGQRTASTVKQLKTSDVPLPVNVKEPLRVGIDRLLGALAVNRLRRQEAAAISIDMGTAVTVDLIAADGAFEGGAILAGPALTLLSLHAATSLPRLDAIVLRDRPEVVGKSTTAAMASGAYWGAVGAVRELVQQIAEQCDKMPDVFLTGGVAPAYASRVTLDGRPAWHVPHLVLAGIRLMADGPAP